MQPTDIVLNFLESDAAHNFVEDNDLNPIAFAEHFVDPDPVKAQTPEILLERARMILATELGKDPLLRQAIRDSFRRNGLVTVIPTARGRVKIDELHRANVRLPPLRQALADSVVHRTSSI